MLIASNVRIHLARQPVDFRKSIDGLCGAVANVLKADPLSGHIFVFHNRRRKALKLLYWHMGGFCMLYKRLERGRFRLPRMAETDVAVELSHAELVSLMEGIDLTGCRWVPHWKPGVVDPWKSITPSSGSG